MNPQNFERACDRVVNKLETKNFVWVEQFLRVTAPQRLPSHVLSAMVLHDYPIDNLMPRFTPPDCAAALSTAVLNNKVEACVFLLEFVTDEIKGLKISSLALRAAEHKNFEVVEVLSQEMSKMEKIWVLTHICSRAQKDSRSLRHIRVGEILLKDFDAQELLKLIQENRNRCVLVVEVCEHMLSLNQKHLLESEVENVGQPNTKRKI